MKKLTLLIILFASLWSFGQGATVAFPQVASATGPIPFVQIHFCTTPTVVTAGICSTPVTVYTNITLTTPYSSAIQTDGLGNFPVVFFTPAANYCYSLSGSSALTNTCYPFSVPIVTNSNPVFSGLTVNGNVTVNALNGYRFTQADSWTCDNAVDDTSAFQNTLNFLNSNGGGTVYLPAKTCLIGGQITLPNDGASPPKQKTIKIVGAGAGGLAQGYNLSCNGGSVLNMTFASTTGKIDTRGLGKLEVSGVCFKDTATDGKPFIFTTLTAIHFNHNQFFGNSAASPKQDVFVLGGLGLVVDGTANSEFQGYGTVIDSNQADQIGRFALLQNQANGIQITNNHVYAFSGNATQGAIEINPGGAIGATFAGGNYISGNLLEVFGYKYGINIVTNGYGNILVGNSCWDATATTTACVNIVAAAGNSANQVIDSNPDLTGPNPSPSFVTVLDSMWTNGQFFGQTGSATSPTFSWSGFASNPPGFYRPAGSALGMASQGSPTHFWNYDQSGQQKFKSDGRLDFVAGSDMTIAADTSICRAGVNKVRIGSGTVGIGGACDSSGELDLTTIAITATLIANLGTPANGTFKYCSDCVVANPCAGGGTGALAKRLNGAWVCN